MQPAVPRDCSSGTTTTTSYYCFSVAFLFRCMVRTRARPKAQGVAVAAFPAVAWPRPVLGLAGGPWEIECWGFMTSCILGWTRLNAVSAEGSTYIVVLMAVNLILSPV